MIIEENLCLIALLTAGNIFHCPCLNINPVVQYEWSMKDRKRWQGRSQRPKLCYNGLNIR